MARSVRNTLGIDLTALMLGTCFAKTGKCDVETPPWVYKSEPKAGHEIPFFNLSAILGLEELEGCGCVAGICEEGLI